MINAPFFQKANSLYKSWLNDDIPATHFNNYFAMDALYEPYLLFKVDEKEDVSVETMLKDPLFILTTNPGGVMNFQKRGNLEAFVRRFTTTPLRDLSYHELALLLGDYYQNEPKIKNARARIQKMIYLAKKLNKSAVVQVEMIPFHSKDFKSNRKHHYAQDLEKDNYLASYTEDLRRLLENASVLSPQGWMNEEKNAWPALIRKTMGLENASYKGLKQSGNSDSIAFVSTQTPVLKGMTLIKGSNNFPSVTYLDQII